MDSMYSDVDDLPEDEVYGAEDPELVIVAAAQEDDRPRYENGNLRWEADDCPQCFDAPAYYECPLCGRPAKAGA